MLQDLWDVSPAALPFVRQFSGNPSRYPWEDDEGVVHENDQGSRALGHHAALRAVQRQLQPGELVLAYLDATCCKRNCGHARTRVHKCGATTRLIERCESQILSSLLCGEGGHCPRNVRTSRSWVVFWGRVVFWAMMILSMLIWRGHIKFTGRCSSASPESPTSNQRGHCASALCQCQGVKTLRVVRPELVAQFAAAHDAGLWNCL